MNYKLAFEILEINEYEIDYKDITLDYIRKKYHKLALEHHPDKNGSSLDSNEKFKRINEAYEYLKREIKEINNSVEDFNNDDAEGEPTDIYKDLLGLFVKGVLDGKYTELFSDIVNDIVIGCKKVSLKLFEDLDKETLITLYTFLSKYRNVLHITDVILEQIRDILVIKYNDVEVYKLNPSINDLLNNNLYKLRVDDELYLVPLWHNELYFDGKNKKEIIVLCDPELPKNIRIDDDNNIYMDYNININEIVDLIKDNGMLYAYIGELELIIPISHLFMKSEQQYRVKSRGLTKIKEDIYDVSEKADIILKIRII